jgi:hypothetical protein
MWDYDGVSFSNMNIIQHWAVNMFNLSVDEKVTLAFLTFSLAGN